MKDVADVKKDIDNWESAFNDWRTEAQQAYSYVAGDQWSEEDLAKMREDNRPAITYNRISPMIRGICGLEVNNRMEVKYIPREMSDTGTNDLLNSASEWIRDECDASSEESDAFRDMVICGIGGIETRYETDSDPEGKTWIERIDPLTLVWDHMSTKKGCVDARWVGRWKRVPASEIERLWPDAADIISLDDDGTDDNASPHNNDLAPWYSSGTGGTSAPKGKKVFQYQYWVDTVEYIIRTPEGGQAVLNQEQFAQVQALGIQGQPRKKRIYRQKFVCGDVELADEELPVGRFTINILTGFRDHAKHVWYGFVRDMMDPQMWINKAYSLTIDILASNAKGGLLAEKTAFANPRQAEEDWSDPRKIIWLNEGGIGKIQDRTSGQIPPALQAILTGTSDIFPQVSGVSMEFLGLAGTEQAGVLEYQRKQSTITTLAELFNAMTQYRRMQGKVMVELIVKFYPGRLIRLTGQGGARYVPLLLQPGVSTYDVIVDEAPSSPDIKGRTWAAMTEMLPMMVQGGVMPPPEVLDYSPLPTSLIEKMKESMSGVMPPQAQQQIEQMKAQMQQGMAVIQQLEAENQRLKQNAEVEMAKLQAQLRMKSEELAQSGQNDIAKLRLQEEIAMLQNQLKSYQVNQEIALDRQKFFAEYELKFMEMQARYGEAAAFSKEQRDMDAASMAEAITRFAAPALGPKRKLVQVVRDGSGRLSGAVVEEVPVIEEPMEPSGIEMEE